MGKTNSLVKNVMTIAKGTAIGQLILFAASPLLSRIYTPAEYGELAVYTILISTLSIFSTMKLEVVMQTEEEVAARKTLKIASYLNLIFTCALLLLIFLTKEELADTLNLSRPNLLLLVPVGIYALGLYRLNSNIYIREKTFTKTKKLFISNSALLVLFQIIFGLLKGISGGLILGDALGRLLSNVKANTANFKSHCRVKITREETRLFLNKKKNFMFLSSLSEFLFVLVNQAFPFLLILFYNPVLAGLYTFGLKIVNAPMVLIGKSVSQVYISEIRAHKKNPQNIYKLFQQIVKRMAVIGIIPYSLLIIFGPDLFSIIFGMEWRASGEMMRIMGIAFFVELIMYPLMVTLEVLEKQRFLFRWQISRGLLIFLVFAILSYLDLPVEITLLCNAFVMVIFYAVLFLYIQKILKVKEV